MAVKMSKPPKPLKVTRDKSVAHGVRWRTTEERKEAKRKIDAIRRANQLAHLQHQTLDLSILRSPKIMLGILLFLVLLGALVVQAFNSKQPQKPSALPLQQNRARRSLQTAAHAMTLFRVHTGSWPSQRLGLYALAKNYSIPGWRGPYINWAYKDPWGTPYVYKMPLSPFEAPSLYSCGPDKQPDTSDDIRTVEADYVCNEGTWKRTIEPDEKEPSEQSHTVEDSND